MSNQIVVCKNCGFRIVNNPRKHRERAKLCPKCLTPYTKPWYAWKPNLNWVKEKLARVKAKADWKEQQYRGRARHLLRLELKREPNEGEIAREIMRLKQEDQDRKLAERLAKSGVR